MVLSTTRSHVFSHYFALMVLLLVLSPQIDYFIQSVSKEAFRGTDGLWSYSVTQVALAIGIPLLLFLMQGLHILASVDFTTEQIVFKNLLGVTWRSSWNRISRVRVARQKGKASGLIFVIDEERIYELPIKSSKADGIYSFIHYVKTNLSRPPILEMHGSSRLPSVRMQFYFGVLAFLVLLIVNTLLTFSGSR